MTHSINSTKITPCNIETYAVPLRPCTQGQDVNLHFSSFILFFAILIFQFVMALNLCAGTASQISQYGITWTFDKQYEVGRFVNGENWVIGPVTIKSVSPGPSGGLNGSMVNPSSGYHAYDSRVGRYDAALGVTYPKTLGGGNSLISTVSWSTVGGHMSLIDVASSFGTIKTAAVLTVLSQAPPADAFRPPYFGNNKRIFTKSQIQYQLLPKLTPPQLITNPVYDFEDMGSRPARIKSMGTVAEQFKRYYERPWILHVSGWQGRPSHPTDNMPNYHREVYGLVAKGTALLLLDLDAINGPGQMDKLLIPFLQLGIDCHFTTLYGGNDSSLPKWPILFAGLLFNEPSMNASKFPDIRSETQIYYRSAAQSPINSTKIASDKFFHGHIAGWRQHTGVRHEYEHLDPSEWAQYDPSNGCSGNCFIKSGASKLEAYRQINSPGYVGPTLAALVMGAKDLWNHPALFDYMIRYVDIEGSSSGSPFVNEMWDAFSKNIPTTMQAPNITPKGGTYVGATVVTISTGAFSGDIYYTLDGNDPTTASNKYLGPITILATGTLKARAFKSGLDPSPIVSAHFIIQADTVAPTVISVNAQYDPTKITVVFSEVVTKASAEAVGNYSLTPPVQISSIILGSDSKTVLLTTSSLTVATTYQLGIINVADYFGNSIAASTVKSFTYTEVNLTNGLIALWAFDEISGTIAKDDIGSNNGLVSGGTWTSGTSGGGTIFFR